MVAIDILADNRVAEPYPKGLQGVYGFAAAVDDVLFDTGQSDIFLQNARRLGVGTDFDSIVLSHSHFDHTGGLQHVLDPGNKPTVYLHPEIWTDRFQVTEKYADPVSIGLPYTKTEVANGAELVEHREPVAVTEKILALGEIPREQATATVGKIERDGELVEDPVIDDQALAIQTPDGVAVVLGCGHSGLMNTIEYAETVTGDEVRFVLGGTHLIAKNDEEIHAIADKLEGQLDLFAGTHCTGSRAEHIFSDRFPEAFRTVGVGTRIELPLDSASNH